ncbi:centrosomal protein of 170 kDa isoform X2 [Xenopus laevis]|uniref:Centrosomal protein of 170 kDa isoform X2 n=1 Tax=Xenopus laevis TaxID=8355 RepID=A0A8J0VG66_XENLA|nr:centrosomal protein of 170 kDa isoform X2 [Xenopus laevis]
MSLRSWFLVSSGGTRHRLPREMIFVGRDDCELMLQSRSVDKQHAVVNYDSSSDVHMVKDLGSLNGTFINDVRIPEQTYITLKLDDKLRFGYDTNLFSVVRGEMRVPEEALKHEKFSSQLHFSQKPPEIEGPKQTASRPPDSKVNDTPVNVLQKAVETVKLEEKLAVDMSAVPRGTPLYGQPSWWGDDDSSENIQHCKESRLHEPGISGHSKDTKEDGDEGTEGKEETLFLLCREPSYFEIPTKESPQKSDVEENIIHEIPTKDTLCSHALGAGHASFTIEFDETSPGKVTIKDHVTKFTPDYRQKSKKTSPSCAKDLSALQTEMMAAESKVADWLAQNNPTCLRKGAPEDDNKSIKSDVPVYLKRLKGHTHDDGTQSDYENSGTQKRFSKSSNFEHLRSGNLEQKKLKCHSSGKHQETSQTAFMIEFFDDDHPRKRRSYSFTQNAGAAGPEAPYPIPQSKIEKVKAASADHKLLAIDLQSGTSSHRVIHSTQHAKLLLKQKSEEPCAPLMLAQNVLLRSSGSLGHRPNKKRVIGDELEIPSVSGCDKVHVDDQADKVRYTKEWDLRSQEAADPSKIIDKETSAGKKRWVSQWASLASNHIGHDQENGRFDVPAAIENDADISESGMSVKSNSSAASLTTQNDRVRRTLPQLPKEEIMDKVSKSKDATHRWEIGEKQDTELQEKETPTHVPKKDKLNSLETRCIVKMDHMGSGNTLKLESKPKHDQADHKQCTSSKSSSMQITVKPIKAKDDSKSQKKDMQSNHTEDGRKIETAESDRKDTAKSLVRQGSFTIDKPSTNVPIELIPRINKPTGSSPTFASVNNITGRSDSVDTDSSMDTTFLLKDTEAVMAFLEAKLKDDSKTDDGPETPSYNQDNSISPESDVDTASTISLAAGDAEKKCPQKQKTFSSLYKETSSFASKDFSKSASLNREKIDKKNKGRGHEVSSRTDIHKTLQTSQTRNRQPSVGVTDEQTSRLSSVSDIVSSDQETYSGKSVPKCKFNAADELLHSKMTKDKGSLAKSITPSKSVTLPRPRPTRTSLLRRSRLGEASDSEIGDADKASVASEVSTTSSTSKPPSGKKALSRIDLLAQPRRTRLGSFSARSDSEAIISRNPGSSRTPDFVFRSGLKSHPPTDLKGSTRARANSISRLSDTKTRSTAPTLSSPPLNVRWRRTPPDYASTSEDEFGSNRNSLKPTRLRTSPAKSQRLHSTGIGTAIQPATSNASTFKHRVKEQEDYIRDWTAHREEIARISQDLALIAREINDVAGEIDSVTSSGTAASTTVSTAATTPGSAIDTREELIDRVFDESLNFRKIPPLNQSRTPEANFRSSDSKHQQKEISEPQAITRRKTWSRDEAMGDSLLLSSVFQFSRKIRQAIDKTANKIRILFKDKERNWDEIEKKLRAESDIPILKTSCVEILSILQELKRVEKQLQVINIMIDPDGTLEALNLLGFSNSISPVETNQNQSRILCPAHSSTLLFQPEKRTSQSKITSVSSEFSAESDPDFAIHFNRFNPDGKEDTMSHE